MTAGLRSLAREALGRLRLPACEVGVLVCDDRRISALNGRYRGKDAATDVLSFPDGEALPEGGRYLGDVAISLETAARQAAERGVPVVRELELLLLHALIHLAGHDHERDGGEMERLEGSLRRELLP